MTTAPNDTAGVAYSRIAQPFRDPLESLKAPNSVEPVEEDLSAKKLYFHGEDGLLQVADVKEFEIKFDLDAQSIIDQYDRMTISAEKAREQLGIFRKVMTCYGCDEFAFDGTFTAYMTDDEGEQPFCYQCVAGIEKRSKPVESHPFYGGSWVTPMTDQTTFTHWTRPTNHLMVSPGSSGNVLVASGDAGVNWAATHAISPSS